MTKHELRLLLSHENMFSFFFDGIAETYANQQKLDNDQLPHIDYNEPFQQIPNKLYKYIDLKGGLTSIIHSNIQFSDPLGFWKLEKLADKTEFWFDRLYMDNVSLEEMYKEIVRQHPSHSYFDKKDVFIYLLHHHILNLTKRNKVLCLAKTHLNQELWKDNPTGICIEYDTNLFRDKLIKFSDNKKYDLIGNPVCYVDKLIKYPIRLTSYSWLSNLIFVKKSDPFAREGEYRILCTDENYSPVRQIISRKDRIENVVNMLLYDKFKTTSPLRPTFDRSYIKKVYYKNTVEDERTLLEELKKYDIPLEKL